MSLSDPVGPQPPADLDWAVTGSLPRPSPEFSRAGDLLASSLAPGFIDLKPLCDMLEHPPFTTLPEGAQNRYVALLEDRFDWRDICERRCDPNFHFVLPACSGDTCSSGEMRKVLEAWYDPDAGRKLTNTQINYLIDGYAPGAPNGFPVVCEECTYTGDRDDPSLPWADEKMFATGDGGRWSGTFFWSFTSLGLEEVPRWNEWEQYSAGDLVQMKPCMDWQPIHYIGPEFGCNPPFNNKYYIAQSGSGVGPRGEKGREILGRWQNIDFYLRTPYPSIPWPGTGCDKFDVVHNEMMTIRNNVNFIPNKILIEMTGAAQTFPGADQWEGTVFTITGDNTTYTCERPPPYPPQPKNTFGFDVVTGWWFHNIPGGINTGALANPEFRPYYNEFGACSVVQPPYQNPPDSYCDPSATPPSPSAYWETIPNPYWEEVSEEWLLTNFNLATKWIIKGCCSSSGSYDLTTDPYGGCVGDTSPNSLFYLYNNP